MRKLLLIAGSAVVITFGFWIAVASYFYNDINSRTRPPLDHDITMSPSPDGKSLVFNAAGEGGTDLYLFELTTKAVRLVARTPDYEVNPRFSPDGQSIVYEAGHPGELADHVYTRNLATGRVQQVTSGKDNDRSPMFFPDGKRIVFARDTHGGPHLLAPSWSDRGTLWSINVDGSGLKRLLPEDIAALSPGISSDGKSLLWWNEKGVFTAPSNGKGAPSQIAGENARDSAFAPHDRRIVYIAGEFVGNFQICVVSVNGGTSTVLTQAGKACMHPVFSPDGATIYYLIDYGVANGLWQIKSNGSQPQRLANTTLFTSPLDKNP